MRNFVCIRARKCHCWGDGSKPARRVGVGGLTKHDLRLIDTPNADEKRLEQNMICSEETSWQPVPLTRSLAKLEPGEMAFSRRYISRLIKRAGFSEQAVSYRDFLVPGIPSPLIRPSIALSACLERIPVVNHLSQSLFIEAAK